MGKRPTIKQALKQFKKTVNKDFPLAKVIFFGSRATGKTKRYSDVDLILVSPKFRRMDFIERGSKMYDYWKIKLPVDFLCYTPSEFNKLSKRVTIVSKAIEEGIFI